MLLHCGGTSWVANATILGEPLINQPGLMKIRCWHHMTNHDWKIKVMKWWYQCWLRVPCSIHRVTKRNCSKVDDFIWPCHLHLRFLLMLFLTIYHNRHKTHHIHSYTLYDCIRICICMIDICLFVAVHVSSSKWSTSFCCFARSQMSRKSPGRSSEVLEGGPCNTLPLQHGECVGSQGN